MVNGKRKERRLRSAAASDVSWEQASDTLALPSSIIEGWDGWTPRILAKCILSAPSAPQYFVVPSTSRRAASSAEAGNAWGLCVSNQCWQEMMTRDEGDEECKT
eukprot:221409-Pelagomonas_calceolata.AAC.1